MRREAAFALLCAPWLGAAAPAAPGGAALPYDFTGMAGPAAPLPVRPGEQYPPQVEERAAVPPAPEPAAAPARKTDWSLSVDTSVTADSNVTNGTRLRTVTVDYEGQRLPASVDPRVRAKSGAGLGASASAGVKVPVSPQASLTLGAEGYVLEYEGGRNDDASALLAAGVELSAGRATGSLQLIAFDRRYGGLSAMKGWGLRGSYRSELAPGQHVTLYVDARLYDSDYGEPFGGEQGGLWLSYDAVLDPTLTAAGGLYVRRDDLRDDRFASTEFGGYGSLTHYLSGDFTGGISAGFSRVMFDAPITFLALDPRRDWRVYASLYLATRRPVAWGVTPSLTYTYSRTMSSVGLFDADRHRLRLGLARTF